MKKRILPLVILMALALSLAFTLNDESPEVGKSAPTFTLTDTNGNAVNLGDFKGKVVVLEWLNHGCPFVKKHYNAENMQALQKKYTEQDIVWLSIVSSAPGKQGHDSPEGHNAAAEDKGAAATAILVDEDGAVGRMYDAKTTPHMYIIDTEGMLVYKGGIDDKPSANPKSLEGATNYVAQALDEMLSGQPVSVSSTRPYGCSVKY